MSVVNTEATKPATAPAAAKTTAKPTAETKPLPYQLVCQPGHLNHPYGLFKVMLEQPNKAPLARFVVGSPDARDVVGKLAKDTALAKADIKSIRWVGGIDIL